MTEPQPARAAPRPLWLAAKALLDTLYMLFGAPEDVAARHTLLTGARALMLDWLRAGEALMRRLLLIEAAAFEKPNARPLLHPKRLRVRRLQYFSAEAPEAWRVGFRCFGPPPSRRHTRGRQDAGGPREPKRFHSAWPLAERYEALLRAFNDPFAHARRLAARLYAAAHRAVEMLLYPPGAEHRVGAEAFAAAGDAARARLRRFDSG